MSLTIDLNGRRALVTGATDGVGAGVARALSAAGCRVAGSGRVSPEHDRAQELLTDLHEGVYLQGDLSDPAVPERLMAEAVEALGGLDVLVSNAGVNVFRGLERCTEADWAFNLELNLAAHWRLAKAALPHLRASGRGVVEIMTSNHGFATIPGCFPYQTVKTALRGMVQAMAIEWGPAVRAVGIAPGFIDTAGNQTWFDSFDDPAAERARTEALHPVKRLGTAKEVGAFCAFLASDHAAFMSGCTYLMDGGRSALLQDGAAL